MAAIMKKASIIIQARMGASRLPDKVLLPLAGKPVLEHVIRRCQHAKYVDRVIVATTVSERDLAVVHFASGMGVGVFCGSESDVLDRYYQVARLLNFQHVVRVTADCPAIDPNIIDRIISEYFNGDFDYVSNTLQETYPDGQDVEVLSFTALQRAWQDARLSSEREHVTPYIFKNNFFKTMNVVHQPNLSQHRWTLDEPRDFQKLTAVFEALYSQDPFFSMEAILDFLAAHPDIDRLNSSIRRNEGYQKSLLNDRD